VTEPAAANVGVGRPASLALLLVHVASAAFFLANRAPGTDAAVTGFPLDDSWIHLVYGRSLAHLEGFAYNPGQLETGFTSPLWAALLAPAFWLASSLAIDVVGVVKAMGVALGFACSWTAARLVITLSGRRLAGLAAGGAIALEPALTFDAVSGMEVLAASLAVLAMLALLAEGRLPAAGLALALAPLGRPEQGLLTLAALPIAGALLMARRAGAGVWLRVFGPSALAGIAWIVYDLAVSGRPLPGTFYVKSLDASGVAHGVGVPWNLRVIGDVLADTTLGGWGAGAWLWLAGTLGLARLATTHREGAARAAALLLALYAPLLLIGLAFTHTLPTGDYYYWARYVHPALPAMAAICAVGAASLLERISSPRSGYPVAERIGSALAIALTAIALAGYPGKLAHAAERFAWNCQNMNEVQVEIGRWLAAHTEADARVGTVDAGAIRFFGNRETVDLLGLNSHTLLSQGDAQIAQLDLGYVVGFATDPPTRRFWSLSLRHRAGSAHYTVAPNAVQASMAVYEVTPVRPGS